MSIVEDTWIKLTKDLPENKYNWWTKIVNNLTEKQRKYHNLELLQFKIELYFTIKNLIKNPQVLEFALFFSYFDYDPQNTDTHIRNIEHFKQFVTDCNMASNSQLVNDVISLLECTSSHLTEEHMTEGAVGEDDKHYFLDIDMSVLGSTPEQYQLYAENVRKEYDFLDQPAYNSLRVKVLQSFLQIPNIFATEEFRNKFEEQARKNIEKEVLSLQ